MIIKRYILVVAIFFLLKTFEYIFCVKDTYRGEGKVS